MAKKGRQRGPHPAGPAAAQGDQQHHQQQHHVWADPLALSWKDVNRVVSW